MPASSLSEPCSKSTARPSSDVDTAPKKKRKRRKSRWMDGSTNQKTLTAAIACFCSGRCRTLEKVCQHFGVPARTLRRHAHDETSPAYYKGPRPPKIDGTDIEDLVKMFDSSATPPHVKGAEQKRIALGHKDARIQQLELRVFQLERDARDHRAALTASQLEITQLRDELSAANMAEATSYFSSFKSAPPLTLLTLDPHDKMLLEL